MNKRDFMKQGISFGMGSFFFARPCLDLSTDSTIVKPSEVHFELNDLIGAIENDGNDIEIEEQDTRLFKNYVTDGGFQAKSGKMIFNDIEGVGLSKNITISEDQKIPFSLFSASIRWSKVDRLGPNMPLFGGFSFNQGMEMLLGRDERWKSRQEDFWKYEENEVEDKNLLSDLIWFESPTAPNVNPPTAYYGCVLSDGMSFPHDFYFYDDGVIYPLPFNQYAEYLRALIANVGVECWQYFYVDPALLVGKNRGLNYMTTDLRAGTRLVEDINAYLYNESYDFDRLDLIYEYLLRVTKVLPEAFPTFNFDHQTEYMNQLESLL